MATMNRNIPLSIDDELLAEIDRVAEATRESRSAVMRRAIREGLPLVQSGGGADIIVLDSETSKDVDTASKEAKSSRAKIIIAAIRDGIQATYTRVMRDHWVREQDANPNNKEAQMFAQAYEHSLLTENPMGHEVRAAMRQRGAALTRFWDILSSVPAAFERYKLVEKLIKIRRKRGSYPAVWGCGLSTEEIRWQIEMDEKYDGKEIPQEEINAHRAAEDAREHERSVLKDEVLKYLQPPYPEE